MSSVFNIVAIIGFACAAVLIIVAVVLFFTWHIKQVRDDLTGKTATRSIAEIRSRAKTRKRASSQAAKNYGWEKEDISTDALKATMDATSGRAAMGTGPVAPNPQAVGGYVEIVEIEDEAGTTTLVHEHIEYAMPATPDDGPTTLLSEKEDEEEPTTSLEGGKS